MSVFMLEKLKEVMPCKWRVQSIRGIKASCIPYIDARQVMDILDAVVGAENWQTKFENIDNKLFCGIGIKFESAWVWKYDTGTESNIEKEKGEVSDAIKRAGVQWGIGRFLYEMRSIYLDVAKYKEKDYGCESQNGHQDY